MNTATNLKTKKPGQMLPYVISGTFLLFFGYIGFFVTQAMKSEVNLVSKDYYQKELAFQQHLDDINRTQKLTEVVTVVSPAGSNQAVINIPAQPEEKLSGTISFFRPADATLDFEVPIKVNADGNQIVNTEKLAKGKWRVKISFTKSGEQYYNETEITL
jgi:nitrogen fixation protein FixH